VIAIFELMRLIEVFNRGISMGLLQNVFNLGWASESHQSCRVFNPGVYTFWWPIFERLLNAGQVITGSSPHSWTPNLLGFRSFGGIR
jgi:hypothetical protein